MKTQTPSSEEAWEGNVGTALEVFLNDDAGVGPDITLENHGQVFSMNR